MRVGRPAPGEAYASPVTSPKSQRGLLLPHERPDHIALAIQSVDVRRRTGEKDEEGHPIVEEAPKIRQFSGWPNSNRVAAVGQGAFARHAVA